MLSTSSQEQAPKRPLTVLIALILITGGIVCSIIEIITASIPGIANNGAIPGGFSGTEIAVATCIFSGFLLTLLLLYYKIGQGRNWARKLHLAIEVSSIIIVSGILQEPVEPYYKAADILALALLFWPTSSAWFKAMEAHRETISAT